jgi:NAD(P)-dependent dehydrogenase (short-subunit alcohol dehydrogenase family)
MRARDCVVVITGASSGMGRATAEAFAEKGARVVLAARRAEELAVVADSCRRKGSAGELTVPTDVADPDAVHQLALRALDRFGRIDVWINGAATAAFGRFQDIPVDVFRRVLDTDLLGVVHGSRAAVRAMRESGGVLINVSAAAGPAPVPYSSPSAVAKAAVRTLDGVLRQELLLARSPLRVCTVLPASMDTPFLGSAANYSGRAVTPMPPIYTPERAARRIVRLVRMPRREIHVGPAALFASLAERAAPATAERLLALQADRAQLSRTRTAPTGPGNTRRPSAGGHVHGGWGGRRRTALRRVTTGAAALTAAAVCARRGTRRHGRASRSAG